ncbi:MAG: hypothetical protein JW888_07495 [Pirellulales bacterium]|nr:hypothetical protein [Pirellulales bacterium]
MSQRNRLVVLAVAAVLFGAALIALDPIIRPSNGTPTDVNGDTPALRAAFDAEFLSRPDGYQGLCKHYGFTFPEEPLQMAPGLMYKAAADGTVDVIDAFATDGRIAAYDLVVLEDDRHFFLPYLAAPVIRRETLKKHPELERVLNLLAGAISDEAMRRLNYEVDENGAKARDVARGFLQEKSLLGSRAAASSDPEAVVRLGSKSFTEQEVLGEMMTLLIESHTSLRVERRLTLGGTMLCFNALRAGDIDLYPEYTGTGLVNILKLPVDSDPSASYQTVQREFAARYDLVWLKPFGFNNTYTLTMRKHQAESLGLRLVSQLVEYLEQSKAE